MSSENHKPHRGKYLPLGNGPGTFLSKEYRSTILAVVNAVLNLKVMAPKGDGSSQLVDADVKMTELGLTITLPAQYGGPVAGGGSGTSLELTDGTTDLTNVTKITVTGLTVGGTSAAATLAVGGGGVAVDEEYDNTHAYAKGSEVWVFTTLTVGGVTVQPGVYKCILAAAANGTGNQVPQFQYPAGTKYWFLISLGVVVSNVCTSGGNQSQYFNASGSF